MGYTTLTGGMNLVIPDTQEENWGPTLRTSTWDKINVHTHTGSPDGNKIPAGGIELNAIGKSQLSKNVALTQQSVAASGATTTVNWNNGNKCVLTLTADTTLTLTNPIEGGQYLLQIIQDATTRVITWPANVKFAGSVEPSQFLEVSLKGLVVLEFDGTNYYCNWDINY